MAAPAPAPHTTRNTTNVDHLYCCNPNLALCGDDLTAVPEGREHDTLCALCVLADDLGHPCSTLTCPNRY
jgi:hypothetical protein